MAYYSGENAVGDLVVNELERGTTWATGEPEGTGRNMQLAPSAPIEGPRGDTTWRARRCES